MRLLPPDASHGPRATILALVERVPGIHLRGIERETALPLGQVLYHLDRLERMGLVASARDAGHRRYYSARDISRHEKPVLAALRHAVPRRVVVALLERPGLTHKDLLARTHVAGSTLTFHLQRLMASGVLDRSGPGYVVRDVPLAARELAYHRASFADPEVDRFVRALLERLPS